MYSDLQSLRGVGRSLVRLLRAYRLIGSSRSTKEMRRFRKSNPGVKWLIDEVENSYHEIKMHPKIRASHDALPALIVSHVKKKYPNANKRVTRKLACSIIKIKNMG